MKNFFTHKTYLKLFLVFFLLTGSVQQSISQQVLLQGYWWDFWNSNYPNEWADYLAELSPRLHELGIDAVWVPPSIKNGNQGVGYSPFDNYDLGDKYQKGILRTRLGNKDELLRMVAVMHANGVSVVQDVVLNHSDGAGSLTGAGGQDPEAWEDYSTSKYKNFRFASYATPVDDESETDYLSRSGRFSKNWQNFHPNPDDNSISGDWNAVWWGPDISYNSGAIGQSSNAIYNPVQSTDYMMNSTRDWLVWYKKQMNFDGFRFDAVKHFPDWAIADFLWNIQYNAGWASAGGTMFSVGEYVGSASEMDAWVSSVSNRSGTFDFSLRGALYNMVSSGGTYDLGSIPGQQQNSRVFYIDGKWVHRTVPFVNNHDTFRPQLDANGNYIGWNTGDELAAHIDPYDVRLSVAYAIAFALDGSPQVFFEDLFDIGRLGNRFTHDPTSASELPVRSDIANIIWCHQNLHFKDGVYKVRHQSPDHLIIERSGKAIISVNDTWDIWQNTWIPTDFAPGTALVDYSGANGSDVKYVNNDGWVNINTPPVNGANATGRKGYAVWAPSGIATNYSNAARTTTQEWEMDDDLGDCHPNSLGEGGKIPANSVAERLVGRIYVEAGKNVNYNLYPSNTTQDLNIILDNGSQQFSSHGKGTISGNVTFNSSSWVEIRVQNTYSSNSAQKVWVKINYQAPAVVNTSQADLTLKSEGDYSNYYEILKERNMKLGINSIESAFENSLSVFPNPISTGQNINISIKAKSASSADIIIYDAKGSVVYSDIFETPKGELKNISIETTSLSSGIYLVRSNELNLSKQIVIK